jgi:hypothetical protein
MENHREVGIKKNLGLCSMHGCKEDTLPNTYYCAKHKEGSLKLNKEYRERMKRSGLNGTKKKMSKVQRNV